MGKFDDALKKADEARGRTTAKPTSEKVVEISTENIEPLKLDTRSLDPHLPNRQVSTDRIDPRLVCIKEPTSPAAECFKALRTKLFCASKVCRGRAIVVTSSQPFDGKSLVVANLAVSIAQGINDHVLLVDCDLRRPTLHKIFGLQAAHGLHEYLKEGSSVAPYLLKTPVRKLTLFPAGRPSESPSELMTSKKMQQLVEELKNRYSDRYVLIDTPPAQFAAETAFLMSIVDGSLLVVRSGKTSRKLIEEVIEHIGQENFLGIVFNTSIEVERNYRYYYRYYQKDKA